MPFLNRLSDEKSSVRTILEPFPEVARPLNELTDTLMRRGAALFTTAERELLAAYTSGLNACAYCFGTHTNTAVAFGIDGTLFEALLEDLETAPVTEKMKPVLRFVKKLTLSPDRMTQADADAIFEAGWDERAFHYAVSICGLFNYYNRLLDGYGVKGTTALHEVRGRSLAESGYLPSPRRK